MKRSRRNFLNTMGITAVASALPGLLSHAVEDQVHPNIVLIMADDLGYECLGTYGGTSYDTPNLDHMAQQGMKFTQCHAMPNCTPTRLQLMTGKYAFRTWMSFGLLNPWQRTFGHFMKRAGYDTCISGKWQLHSYNPPDIQPEWRGRGMDPMYSGFDEYFLWHSDHTEDKGSRYADPVIEDNGVYRTDTKGKYGPEMYTDYILDYIERKKDTPFFVYYPMALTHGPFNPTPHSDVWETGDRLESDTKYFKDMVEYMDFTIGRILNKIDELGLGENTLVLFLGDNGTPGQITSRMGDQLVRGGKSTTTDAGTHVPLIARWTGVVPAGRVCDDLVDSIDFIPTITEAGRVTLPPDEIFDGHSFYSQLKGEKPVNPREWIYCLWQGNAYEERNAEFVRDKKWKLYTDDRLLYDLENDILEKNPISIRRQNPEEERARKRLRSVLNSIRSNTLPD